MKSLRKNILAMIILAVVIVAAVLILRLVNGKEYWDRELAVICINPDAGKGEPAVVQEIGLDGCREQILDYDRDLQTLLYINTEGQITEKSLITGDIKIIEVPRGEHGGERSIDNVKYGPNPQQISMVSGDELCIYDVSKDRLTKLTPCFQSKGRNTFLWKNSSEVFTLVNTLGNHTVGTIDLFLYNILDNHMKQIKGYYESFIGMEGDNRLLVIRGYDKPHAFGVELINKIVEVNLEDGSIHELQTLDSEIFMAEYYDGNLYWVEQKHTKRQCKVFCLNIDTGKKRCIYKTDKRILGIVVGSMGN